MLASAAAIQCYMSDVSYDSEKFTLLPTEVIDCPETSDACITRTYSGANVVAHDCSKGYENCTISGVQRDGVDLTGKHTYSCCKTDNCNNKELRLPEVEEVLVNAYMQRPECNVWMPKEYDVVAENQTLKVEDLQQEFMIEKTDQRSQWTYNIQPPTADSWLYSRDTSSPSCFMVSGEIKSGFCGVRYNVLQDGSKAQNLFGEDDVTFEGTCTCTYTQHIY